MKIWMLNCRLEDWKESREYAGFASGKEMAPIHAGDALIYFCNGQILGVFEAEKNQALESAAPESAAAFRIKLKKILVPENGLLACPLHYKMSLQPHAPGSPRLWEISGWEYGKIMQALTQGSKELVF